MRQAATVNSSVRGFGKAAECKVWARCATQVTAGQLAAPKILATLGLGADFGERKAGCGIAIMVIIARNDRPELQKGSRLSQPVLV